jgi:hypothetical protein
MTIHHARLKRLVLAGAAFFLFLFLPGGGAGAVTVSPVLFDMDIAPGATAQDKIVLTNDTDERQTFAFLAENFTARGEEGGQEYIHEDEPTGLASWVYPDRPSVTLDPGQSAEFPFLISVPEDAEPGGHYATIFFSRGAGDGASSAKGGVGITEQIGVLLLVRVPGDIMEKANVESFRMAKGTVLHRLPAEFELRVRNTGSVHVRPTGTLVIRNLIGITAARLPANPKQSAVLPGSVRKIENAWLKTAAPEDGGFWAEAANEWRNFALGRYAASVELAYGSRQELIRSQTVHFWVIPWRVLLLALGAFIALIILVKVYNAIVVRAALRKSG